MEEFGEFFADIFTAIPPMIELHAGLRRRGIPTYIFSNTNDLAIEHVRRNFPFFRDFDGYIYSYEVKAMKPDAKIYEAMEKLRRTARRGHSLSGRPAGKRGGAARRAAGGRFCTRPRKKRGWRWRSLGYCRSRREEACSKNPELKIEASLVTSAATKFSSNAA